MTVNIGKIDRTIRALFGIVLVALPFLSGLALFESGTATIVSVVIGIVMLATSAMRFCPLYTLFGIRTCQS